MNRNVTGSWPSWLFGLLELTAPSDDSLFDPLHPDNAAAPTASNDSKPSDSVFLTDERLPLPDVDCLHGKYSKQPPLDVGE